jgi:hypothetical protein
MHYDPRPMEHVVCTTGQCKLFHCSSVPLAKLLPSATSTEALFRGVGSQAMPTIYTPVEHSTRMIIEIIASLKSSERPLDLIQDLKLLNEMLSLAGVAIQTYSCTPLGPGLAGVINQIAFRCCIVLQELIENIEQCRQGLTPTKVHHLWRHVLWSGFSDKELALLKDKLLVLRESFNSVLMALASYVSLTLAFCFRLAAAKLMIRRVSWKEFGDKLRKGSEVSIGEFISLTKNCSSLHHIPVSAVLVIDHLGQNIRVPIIFCSTWKVDFVHCSLDFYI